MIYFMQPTDGGPLKIGFTDNLPARHKQLEAHYGRPLAVLATMPGERAEEAELHARFAHLRLAGPGRRGVHPEQFRPGPDLMDFIGRSLFVNQGDVEMMPVRAQCVIIHLKGTPEYAAWLEAVNQKTHIPKAAIFRLAVAQWAAANGLDAPPEK